MRNFIIVSLVAWLLCSGNFVHAASENIYENISVLTIQDEGRLKPLDTFARENVLLITGKSLLSGRSYWELFLSWLGSANAFEKDNVVRVTHIEYKKLLGLPDNQQHFTGRSLLDNPKFKELYEEIRRLRLANQELPQDFKYHETEQLAVKLEHLYGITTRTAITVVPPVPGENVWRSLGDIENPEILPIHEKFKVMISAYEKGDSPNFSSFTKDLHSSLVSMNSSVYPSLNSMKQEVFYNTFKPFKKSWILYLITLLVVWTAPVLKKNGKWLFALGILSYVAGFVIHTYGFILRCIIAGRAPVANMYESVIWVAWGAVLLSLIFFAIYKNRALITSASVMSVIALILADNLPSVLNPSIMPLAPVLRSNFWLTTHVLTITLSYAAFMLSLGIGHLALIAWWRSPQGSKIIEELTQFIYKGMQVGVLLLAAGTILGGVWADYSWGRFWGWDPKEVWALIALLGYLAILHGRHIGWLTNFGLAVSSVVGFLGVLMAWYGVNYVLGVGLHSYGFGGGGTAHVALFTALDLLFVGIVALRVKRSGKLNTSVN